MSDLTQAPSGELFQTVRAALSDAASLAALDELERRCQESAFGPPDTQRPLPVPLCERIREVFGGGSRTFEAIARRYRFAFKVWDAKYGPLNAEQADYGDQLVLWAINKAAEIADPSHRRASLYTRLDLVVNHERTNDGFKSRAQHLDVSAQIEGLAA